jgi:two-component system sensor histidine kinase GlrK
MRLSIYTKMLVGFGVIILLMIAANAYVLDDLYDISTTARTTISSDVSSVDLAKQLQMQISDIDRQAQKFLISRDAAYFELYLDETRVFSAGYDSLLTAHRAGGDVDLVRRLGASLEWLNSTLVKERQRKKVPPKAESEHIGEAISDTLDTIRSTLGECSRSSQLAVDRSMQNVETITNRSLQVALFLVLGTLVAAILLALLIARTMTRPLRALIAGVAKIGTGAFDEIRVDSNDEIGLLAGAVNDMSSQLRRMNELKAELTNQILHELQTPVTAILGAHHLISSGRMGTITEDQKRMLDLIKENVDRLRDFSHQLLDIAKVEAGMMVYNFAESDLNTIVDVVVRTARIAATRKNISVNVEKATLPPVTIDEEKIATVLSNLLTNAIKYTGDSGTVQVRTSAAEQTVSFSVTDSGIGIAEEDLPHIFTKFYRATNSKSAKGTGIGLSLVKAFTDGHGGTVTVTSRVGSGTAFTVELPLLQHTPKNPYNGGSTESTAS